MLEEDIDDTHMCIKCSTTIVGIENYIQHRKSQCSGKANTNRCVHQVPVNHHVDHHANHYEAFDFTAQSTSFTKHNEKQNKSISENYDLPYDLGADIFFQSLELQSSSKRTHNAPSLPTSNIVKNPIHDNPQPANIGKVSCTGGKVSNRKSGGTPVLNHSDEWITPTPSNNSENLMKAVRDISGSKKCDSIFKLIPFQHDSPDHSDDGHVDEDDLEEEDEDELDEEDEDYLRVPSNHTGGKWKPDNSYTNSPGWENNHHWHKDMDEFENDLTNPPPSHTKGKWVPGTKIVKLNYKEDAEIEKIFTHQYWCNTCNRKLASKVLYERHLKSNLHIKRAKPEQELEKAALQTMSERLKKPSVYLNPSIYSSGNESPAHSAKNTEFNASKSKKRKRRKHYIKCETCNTRLPKYLLGKHLISHFHYRRMITNPSKSLDLILENIHKIVYQSPFQCQPCRFYCNTESDFMLHWNSNSHSDLTEGPGKFWCMFCKFECEDNNQMRRHLLSSDHNEVILAINRSVPIVIRKKIVIECTKCKQSFRYNMELRKHAEICSKEPVGTASNDYQSKFKCEICGEMTKSQLALQKHLKIKHSQKIYFCSTCQIQFKTPVESIKHRNTSSHKFLVQKHKHKENISKKCKFCCVLYPDLNSLKTHILESHPDETYACSYCGKKFAISQELGRHVRDKVCQSSSFKQNSAKTKMISPKTSPSKDMHLQRSSTPKSAEILEYEKNKNEKNQQRTEILEISIANIEIEKSTENEKTVETVSLLCQKCNFKTASTAELVFHETLHNLPTNWKRKSKLSCPICSKTFHKHSLRLHLRIHTNERIFKCSHCEMAFVRKYNLKEHIEKIHLKSKTNPVQSADSNEEYKCDVCDKTYNRILSFKQHLNTHKQRDERFKCQYGDCIFSGRNSHDLKMHQTTHTNEKIFECNFDGCKYLGKNLVNLKKHQKSHLDLEKKFACTECVFETKYATHMRRHVAIHSGDKTHKCPHCAYASSSKENLRRHILRTIKHSGRFLYECKLCDQTDDNRFQSNFEREYKAHLVLFHKVEKDLNELLKS